MTTFTMQDLNNMEVTQEEDQAMEALTEKQKEAWVNYGMANPPQHTVEQIETAQNKMDKKEEWVYQAPQAIQSVMGFQYAPMDTSPQAQELSNLFVNLTSTMQAIIKLCVETQTKGQPSEGLNETVATVLQNAEWFKEMVDREVDELLDDKDFAYEINSEVEDWFSNSFSLDDHVDITAEVESKVEDIAEDLLKDIVEERLAEIVSDKLQNLRITFD